MLFRYAQRNAGADPVAAARLALELGVTPVTAAVLIGRGVTDAEEGRRYFASGPEALRDPFGLTDMDRAVARIRAALQRRESICVYGDYDVDGVCATTLLVSALRALGGDVRYYVPSRHSEGYGVNVAAVESLAGTKLLITVDCGITNGAELARAGELGMDVIVTDHHECPDTLPAALAVVNPKRPGQEYGFSGLCGAGVALKVVQALCGAAVAETYSDLAAMATVADIVPLTDENLAIVRMGLQRINAGHRPGIQALREVAGLAGKPVKSGHIGFALGPRINAGGRMDHSAKSVEMLLSDTLAAALPVAQELDGDNRERMAVEDGILTEALAMIEESYDFARDRAIVLYQPHWNTGVTGIVASRIVERYHRPTVLLGRGGHGHDDAEGEADIEEGEAPGAVLYGSGRSVPGVHLFKALKHCEAYFVRYGGHEQAAGCALREGDLEGMRAALNEYLRQTYDDEVFLPLRYYDAEISVDQLSKKLAVDLDALEPAGYGNPRPVFLLRDVPCAGTASTADGKHLRLRLGQGGLEGIAFRQGSLADAMRAQTNCDALAVPQMNEWQGRQRLQAVVEHLRLPQSAEAYAAMLQRPNPPPPLGAPLTAGRALEWEQAMQEILGHVAQGPFGTLVLCATAASAQAVLRVLAERGLLQRVHFGVGTALQAERGENAVVLHAAALPVRRWARVYVLDGPLGLAQTGQLQPDKNRDMVPRQLDAEHLTATPTRGAAANKPLNLQCLFAAAIITVNHMPPAAQGLTREGMLALYRQMQQALAAGQPVAPWQPLGDADPWLWELAARVFCELGLLRALPRSPWLEALPRQGKANLADSPVWQSMTQNHTLQ